MKMALWQALMLYLIWGFSLNSRIFEGYVRHRRFVDVAHEFQYKLFMIYLDLDELDTLFDPYFFWSKKGFNLAAFRRNKYLGGGEQSLLEAVKTRIEDLSGIMPDRVTLLTNLAYYGYCFNPISLYFCWHQEKLTHCIAEVTNTPWGDQHAYVLPAEAMKPGVYRMQFQKAMHVSPFLGMNYEYHMQCKHDADQLIVQLENWQADKKHFDATLSLHARPINSKNMALMLLKYPFMTGKVIAAIHWQALRLFKKRAKFYPHPK